MITRWLLGLCALALTAALSAEEFVATYDLTKDRSAKVSVRASGERMVRNNGDKPLAIGPSRSVSAHAEIALTGPTRRVEYPRGYFDRLNLREMPDSDGSAAWAEAYAREMLGTPEAPTPLRRVLDSEEIDGLYLGLRWNELQPETGRFRWQYPDFWFGEMSRRNKKVLLQITPGTNTPQWVYEQGTKRFPFVDENSYHGSHGKTLVMPVATDEMFVRRWTGLIEAVGRRYADNPALAGICVVGPAKTSGEMHLPKSRADLKEYARLGVTDDALVAVWKEMLAVYARVFPRRALVISVSKILNDNVPTDQIIEHALLTYPNQICLRSAQLNGKSEWEFAFERFGFGLLSRAMDVPVIYGWLGSQPERMGSYDLALENAKNTGAVMLTMGEALLDPNRAEAVKKLHAFLIERQFR
jgi:hypothetical protein